MAPWLSRINMYPEPIEDSDSRDTLLLQTQQKMVNRYSPAIIIPDGEDGAIIPKTPHSRPVA